MITIGASTGFDPWGISLAAVHVIDFKLPREQ